MQAFAGQQQLQRGSTFAVCCCLQLSPQVDYSGLNVGQVWDCTGVFLTRKALQPYFDKGVPKVVVSAPVKDAEHPVLNIVYGVNHVSQLLASCLVLRGVGLRCMAWLIAGPGAAGTMTALLAWLGARGMLPPALRD